MERKEFNDLTRASIISLIKAGIIKSVSKDITRHNSRVMVHLEGSNSTFAEILIGRESSEIINKNDGLDDNLINEASLIIIKENDLDRLRFITSDYTNLHRIFNIPEAIEIRKKQARDLKIITKILGEYWE